MGTWKKIERIFKKEVMGRDVPAADGIAIPQEVKDLLDSGKTFIVRGAVALIEDVAEKAWAKIPDELKAGIPKDKFDAIVDVLKGEIEEA